MDQYHETNPPTELKSSVMGREASKKSSEKIKSGATTHYSSSPRYVWQNISTMPMDRNVWIYCESTQLMCVSNYHEVVVMKEYSEATHWLPLPTPPTN